MAPSKSNLSSIFTAPIMQNDDSRYSRYSTISTDTEYKDNPYRNSIPAEILQQKQDSKDSGAPYKSKVPFKNVLFWDNLKDDTDIDDDNLHSFDPTHTKRDGSGFYPLSGRGWLNFGMITILVAALLMLFAGCE